MVGGGEVNCSFDGSVVRYRIIIKFRSPAAQLSPSRRLIFSVYLPNWNWLHISCLISTQL